MQLRACHPHNFKRLLEYNREKNKFEGVLGRMMQEGLDLYFDETSSLLPNMSTLIQADNLGVGEYREELGRFDGCLGQLQMNKSDLILQLSLYPLDIENVTQGMTIFETGLCFSTGYNRTVLVSSLQVLDSLHAFSPDLWIMCLCTSLAMTLFLSLEEMFYQWVRQLLGLRRTQSNSAVYQVATHLMRRGTIHRGRLTRRIMFVSASLFSLVVIHYFCSVMKTDLVVVKDPLVYNSYDDVIARKAKPLFVKGMSHDSLFKNSNSKEHRHRLWQYASKSFGKDRLYMELTPFLFLLVAVSVVDQNVVTILEDAIMPVVTTSGCSLAGRDPVKMAEYIASLGSDEMEKTIEATGVMDREELNAFIHYARSNELYLPPDLLVHTSRDPRDEQFVQGLIFNSNGDKKLLKVMQRALRMLIELGLSLEKRSSLEQIDLFKNHELLDSILGRPLKGRQPLVDSCKSKSIVKPTVKMQSIKLENMRTLFILIAAVYLLLFFVLTLEIIAHRLHRTNKPSPL